MVTHVYARNSSMQISDIPPALHNMEDQQLVLVLLPITDYGNGVLYYVLLRVRLFVHVYLLILVYYVFTQLVKRVIIHYLIALLRMLLQHGGMPLI